MKGVALVACLMLIPAWAGAHGTSKSFSDWSFEGGQLSGRIAFAPHDVSAAYQGLDADGDGALSAQELAQQAPKVAAYIAEQVIVHSGDQAAGTLCTGKSADLQGLSDPVEEIQVNLSFVCSGRVGALRIRARFLPELEPPHTSVATFVGPGLDATHVFTSTDPQVDLRLEVPSLAASLADGAQQTLQGLLALRPLLLLLALAWLGLGPKGWLLAGAFAVSGVAVAGQPSQVFVPWLGVAAGLWAAVEVWARKDMPATQVAWAVLAGLATGWGLAASAAEAELPVKVLSRALLMVVVVICMGLGRLWPAQVRAKGARAMAAVLALGAVVSGGLTLF